MTCADDVHHSSTTKTCCNFFYFRRYSNKRNPLKISSLWTTYVAVMCCYLVLYVVVLFSVASFDVYVKWFASLCQRVVVLLYWGLLRALLPGALAMVYVWYYVFVLLLVT